MLYDVLQTYLRICAKHRYAIRIADADEADVLACLAYGFEQLLARIEEGDELKLSSTTVELLRNLDARLSQFACSSPRWFSMQEWQSVEYYALKVIEALENEPGSGTDEVHLHPGELPGSEL